MDKSDAEIVDNQELPQVPVNVQQLENRLLDAEVESQGEAPLSAACAAEKANRSENVTEDGKSVPDSRDVLESKAEDPINTKDEAQDLTDSKSVAGDQINTERETVDHIGVNNEANEQIVSQTDDGNFAVNKMVGRNAPEVATREDKPAEVVAEKEQRHKIDEEDKHPDTNVSSGEKLMENNSEEKTSCENGQLPAELSATGAAQNEGDYAQCEDDKMVDIVHDSENEKMADVVHEHEDVKMADVVHENEDVSMADMVHENEEETVKGKLREPNNEIVSSTLTDRNAKLNETAMRIEVDNASPPAKIEAATPDLLVKCSMAVSGDHSAGTVKNFFNQPGVVEGDDGTLEDQAAFMKELERFYRERSMDFKPLKFYGQPLNCLKLWRSVIRLGGYDRVTGLKLWRQVGESFHPPKTCTTVSWTFRIFYEKSLLEYERHKTQSGELQLPDPALLEAPGVHSEGNGYQGSGSGRARRDAASRAMQGWHTQRVSDYGEVGEPIIKDKSLNNVPKREKNLKSIGSLKQKRPNEEEHSVKAARAETSKQLVASVIDVGPPADWVRINVRQTKDCFEVYALVPGLLREEVRVQSDPAGRLVITGQPEQSENPWGITAFRKVVTFPSRIDPVHTSAVVSLHGRLFVRVPFEQ